MPAPNAANDFADPTVVAIDWSGAENESTQRRHIWRAVVEGGQLVLLKNRLTRRETIDWVMALPPPAIVGLDFAFAFPEWFARKRACENIGEVWALVNGRGRQWLKDCEDPFWGRPGRPCPVHEGPALRKCETDGIGQAKSVFQIGGAGAVGTGSLRGMPFLSELQSAGWSIWPFDDPAERTIVEIYPRRLTGKVKKSDAWERASYLARRIHAPADTVMTRSPEFPDDESWVHAIASEDAFDAAISALEMWLRRRDLAPSVASIEGDIWPATR
jgi:hypothetical protein